MGRSRECTNICLLIQQTFISVYSLVLMGLSAGDPEMMFICVNPEKHYSTGMCEGSGGQSAGWSAWSTVE